MSRTAPRAPLLWKPLHRRNARGRFADAPPRPCRRSPGHRAQHHHPANDGLLSDPVIRAPPRRPDQHPVGAVPYAPTAAPEHVNVPGPQRSGTPDGPENGRLLHRERRVRTITTPRRFTSSRTFWVCLSSRPAPTIHRKPEVTPHHDTPPARAMRRTPSGCSSTSHHAEVGPQVGLVPPPRRSPRAVRRSHRPDRFPWHRPPSTRPCAMSSTCSSGRLRPRPHAP